MEVLKRGVKNAFRNKIRTGSIVLILSLSIGLALSMLVANKAVANKIATVKSSVGNTVSVSPAGARGFEGGGDPLTTAEITKLTTLTHVTSVTQSLSDRVTSTNSNLVSAVDAGSLGRRNAGNNGQGFTAPERLGGSSTDSANSGVTRTFTPPVTITGTTSPTVLASTTGSDGTYTLKSGVVLDGTSTENVALLGSTIATKNNLVVGSTFTAYGATIKVVGIFDAGNTFSNNQVIMPLATLQTLSDQVGDVTSATLNVDSIENVASVTTAAKAALGTTADVTNGSERAEATIAPLENIKTISVYSLVAAAIAGAVIVFLTMIMIVRERRREIGVLKAIGASNVKIALQFMSEAVTFTLMAAVIGIGIAALTAQPLTNMLASSSSSSTTQTPGAAGGFRGAGATAVRGLQSLSANVDWTIIGYGLIAALLIAIIGSLLTSFFIAKIRPAEVMRSE